MSTAALTGAPTATYLNLSIPPGVYANSVVYTVPANTIALVIFGILMGGGGSWQIIGVDGLSNPYEAVKYDGTGYHFAVFGGDPGYNRIVNVYPPATPDSAIKGAQFYAYPGEQVAFSGGNGVTPMATSVFIYAVAGS